MTNKELKEILRNAHAYYPVGPTGRRQFRKVTSELAREENIIFVAVGYWMYKRIEYCTQEEKEAYYAKQVAQLQTQYFNRLLPMKKHLRDSFLKEVHQGGLFNE